MALIGLSSTSNIVSFFGTGAAAVSKGAGGASEPGVGGTGASWPRELRRGTSGEAVRGEVIRGGGWEPRGVRGVDEVGGGVDMDVGVGVDVDEESRGVMGA